MTNCLNCENEFNGAFCNLCGQKSATHRFTLHEWLHEIPHSIFHIDSGFFATLKILCVRPGEAIREYLQGKRKLLFSPFLYVLILCGVFVVVSHFFAQPAKIPKTIELATLQETFAYIEEHYYKIIVVAMILPLTFGTYLAYRKSGYNFAEHLVLNAYLIGQLVIADIILSLISSMKLDENTAPIYALIEFALKFPYWFWVYWQFFKPRKWYWGILQFILSQIISGIVLYLLLFGAALILLKFKGAH